MDRAPGLCKVTVRRVLEEGEAAGPDDCLTLDGEPGDTSVAVGLPGLGPGSWLLAVSVNGAAGQFVECPTPLAVS